MKDCTGINGVAGIPDVPGHAVEEFFPGFRCPECEGLYQEGKLLLALARDEREARLQAYLDAHPDIMRRAERDGGFGA